MKAVVQRVSDASVSVDGKITGRIDFGLLVYLGVAIDDSAKDADWLVEKITNLRIFDDSEGKMNHSLMNIVDNSLVNYNLKEVNENVIGVLVISQFTLLGDAKKGRRPSWAKAADPEKAQELYNYFNHKIREQGILCETGIFQAIMKVQYTNEGPVTILLDSKE